MNAKQSRPVRWTAADRARHKAIRKHYQHGPTPEELAADGDHDGPIKSGAYLLVRVLLSQLKIARVSGGLTLANISKQTGIDQATLSRLENGRQANPTVDTLWRYARAVGRELILSHSPIRSAKARNGKPVSKSLATTARSSRRGHGN
jgi:DNA-binding phage protein